MRNTITPFLSTGHVIYEMSSGRALSGVVPTEEEYERVEYDEVKELLQFIFNFVEPPATIRKFWNTQCSEIDMIRKVT